jgi:hypothetical protein
VNALRRLHAALVPGGLVVDTQPISARPPVEADGIELGTLDMRAWRRTVDAVDRLVAETIDVGLFSVESERRFTVADTADDGHGLVDTVRDWQGTTVSDALARRIAEAPPPISVRQDVRLRVLRALSFPECDGEILLAGAPSVAAATGSVCHSGRTEPSDVLTAMDLDAERAVAAVRRRPRA